MLASISGDKHANVVKIYNDKSLSQKALLEYIYDINKHEVFSTSVIRTILAVDGTGSMGSILTKVINILKETVERTTDILK
jgi:hypothetical protein